MAPRQSRRLADCHHPLYTSHIIPSNSFATPSISRPLIRSRHPMPPRSRKPAAKPKKAAATSKQQPPQRRSARAKPSVAYVQPSEDDEDSPAAKDRASDSSGKDGDAYDTAASADYDDDDDDDDDGEEVEQEVEAPVRHTTKKRSANASVSRPAKKKRQQPHDDSSDGEVGVVFYPNRAQSPGDVEYADDRIHKRTLEFLQGASETHAVRSIDG